MKKIIILLAMVVIQFGCTPVETANVSKVTIFPKITINGANPIFVPQGGTFSDPGATALAGTVVLPFTTTATGVYRGTTSLDTSKTDEYAVTYTATNSDGFKASAVRKVIVYKTGDLINSIEGVYTCTISRNGAIPSAAYQNIKYMYIWKNTNGTYEISDAFGGWYQYGRALGLSYITPGGTINAVNIATNSFTFPGNPLSNDGFGGTATITGLTVNPITKVLVLNCHWDTAPPVTAYDFVATMTQVPL